ncbi:MAG: TonB-dependent receptor [Bacteroidota bacterium]
MLHANEKRLYLLLKQGKLFSIIISIACLFFSQTICATSPNIIVTGKVTDESGVGLVGASVKIQGSSEGTSTNTSGEYSISVAENGILIFSYIGYETKEISVEGRSVINVSLNSITKTAEEVVVVGYGTQRKKDLTGAATTIKGSDIVNTVGLTATQAIQGKASGVQIINSGQPGGTPKVRIRGTGSILGGADPLYIVDGIITDDIKNINSADILTIDILKDAASTAIYGARAANGVILITTKSGKVGKLSVSYNMFSGVRLLTHKVEMSKPNLFANYANEAANAPAVLSTDITGATDWYDAITRPAFFTNNSLSLSGGKNTYKFFVSLGYLKDEGILEGTDYQRATVRLNHDLGITKKFKIGNTISFSHFTSNNQDAGAFTRAYIAAPIFNVYNADGSFGNTGKSDVGNIIATIKNNFDRSFGSRLGGTLWGDYEIVKGLNFRTAFGIDMESTNGWVNAKKYTTTNGDGSPGPQNNANSRLKYTRDSAYHWTWDNYFTYSKVIQQHSFKLTVGHTAERRDGWKNEANINDGSIIDISGPSNFIFTNNSNLWKMNFTDTAHFQQNTRTPIANYYKRESYFARLNYILSDKYLLSATFRRDGNSNFSPNNRWANFPSIGLGWIITKEKFMDNQTLFNNLKLRASYGEVGNDVVDSRSFQFTPAELLYAYFGPTRINGTTIIQLKDPNLQWEVVKELNFGVDFSLLKNKLSGEIDYYDKQTSGGLYRINILDLGFGTDFITNAADVSNKGVELALTWADRLNKNTDYTLRGNITFNKNKVENIGLGQNLSSGDVGYARLATRTSEGREIGEFFVYQTNGIYQNFDEINSTPHLDNTQVGDFKIVDRNNDKAIDESDKYYAGSYQPKFFYGFNAGLNWKRFDFGLDIFGTYGGKVYNAKKGIRGGGNYNVEAEVARNHWIPGSGINDIPRAFNGTTAVTDYYIESGSFLRINNITVGYKFNLTETNRLFRSVRLFASAQNPYIFTKYTGFTPELAGDQLSAGIENNIYPIAASYMIGLNVQFK